MERLIIEIKQKKLIKPQYPIKSLLQLSAFSSTFVGSSHPCLQPPPPLLPELSLKIAKLRRRKIAQMTPTTTKNGLIFGGLVLMEYPPIQYLLMFDRISASYNKLSPNATMKQLTLFYLWILLAE